MVFRRGWRSASTGALAFVVACAQPTTEPRATVSASPYVVESERLTDNIENARRLRDRLAAGEQPAGVARVANELREFARLESSGPRADDALLLGGELLAARYALSREPADLSEADAFFDALASRGGAAGCRARVEAADAHQHGGDRAGARARYLSYERACPGASELPHVHAALALLDPDVARAESDAARSRAARATAVAFDPLRRRSVRRVVIDPGHGGSDPGAESDGGLTESQVTLDVARRVAEDLSVATGVQVVLTRDRDVYVPLEDRAARANESDADLFVSIHCNSSPNPESRGVSTYVLDTRDDRVAARVAARENATVESEPEAPPEVFQILANLRLVGQGSRSLALAGAIQEGLVHVLRRTYGGVVDLGIHTARFHVLVGARMPAVLVELSFLSNPLEAARLADTRYRAVLASALTAAIAHYADGTAPTPAVIDDVDSNRHDCCAGAASASPSAP